LRGVLSQSHVGARLNRSNERERHRAREFGNFLFLCRHCGATFPAHACLAAGEAVFSLWGMGDGLTKAETYRRYAAECLGLSKIADDERNRAVLCRLAVAWINLAEYAEKAVLMQSEDA
jgi:hypothetical protein